MSGLGVELLGSDPLWSEPLWTHLFTLAAYVMAAGCLYRGIKHGSQTSLWAAAGQVLIFSTFAALFWFVESYAHHRTPYYVYSTTFSDLIPRLQFSFEGGKANACTELVHALQERFEIDRIPLSVILMEASLTYSAMWTARLLGASLVIQPFLAGLVLLDVDVLLDPVVAQTHDCQAAALAANGRGGVGLWHWFVDSENLGSWFGVPLFNYAAWFSAPVALVALANLLGPFLQDRVVQPALRRKRSETPVPLRQGLLLLTIAAAIGLVFYVAPNYNPVPWLQWLLMLAAIAVVAFIVFRRFGRYRTDQEVDSNLTRPVTVALLLPTIALALGDLSIAEPLLIPTAIATLALGLWLAWLPYRSALERVARRVGQLESFVRVRFFGFTAMLVVLGAAMVDDSPTATTVLGLLVIAVCFHLYAYVLNDVVDMDVDQGHPARQNDPLRNGGITREKALAIALVPVSIAVLTLLHLMSFDLTSKPWAFVVLAAGLLFMLIYNLFGKRVAFPPLTDAVQGLAWGSLALVGAFACDPQMSAAEFWERTLSVGAYGAAFILLVNGIHGGLRDLASDKKAGRCTTAILLGAKPIDETDPTKGAVSTRRIIAFAFAAHTLMFAVAFRYLWRHPDAFYSLELTWVLLVLLFVLSSIWLWRVVKPNAKKPDRPIGFQAFIALLAPIVMYTLARDPAPVFKVVVASSYFFPLLLKETWLLRVIAFAYRPRPVSSPPAAD